VLIQVAFANPCNHLICAQSVIQTKGEGGESRIRLISGFHEFSLVFKKSVSSINPCPIRDSDKGGRGESRIRLISGFHGFSLVFKKSVSSINPCPICDADKGGRRLQSIIEFIILSF